MVYAHIQIFFVFYREQGYWGREEINLLVHAWRSKLSVFFFFFPSRYYFSFSFVLLPFLLNAYFWLSFFLEIPIIVIFRIPFLVHDKGSFIEPAVTGIYSFSP